MGTVRGHGRSIMRGRSPTSGYPGRLERLLHSARGRILPDQAHHLLFLSGLPLLDGVFASTWASGAFDDPLAAMGKGIALFSGAGCLAVACALDGSLIGRLAVVLRVYLIYILPGTFIAVWLMPLIHALLFPGFEVFANLIVIGVMLELIGCRIAYNGPRPAAITAQWRWALSLTVVPQVVLAVALAASLGHLIIDRSLLVQPFAWLDADPNSGSLRLMAINELALAAAAIGAACVFTAVGAIVGAALDRDLMSWVRYGGVAALGCIPLETLGVGVPDVVPLLLVTASPLIGWIVRALVRLTDVKVKASKGDLG